ncbi:MAG: D-glycero-beta-D-manno-heptose 1-phosphate adenylyltransferase [Bacteroidetes bacterium]|nr:D-glycero-beta-D-manno-heptose 1-phosphate adenylyltransferase [Bacteroidota bacterium]
MKRADLIIQKIINIEQAKHSAAQWRINGKTIAFTNGIFDILHEGHIYSLSQAAKEADYLIVGLNSDASTKRLKGSERPVNAQQSRAIVLASLIMVDAVIVFEEDTPLDLIKTIMPDVLIKGGDYTIDQIAGAKEIIANGGKVIINQTLEGFSTTGIIKKMRE